MVALGACMVARGGMYGCSGGAGGMHGCSWGGCVVALGGCAWLLPGGVRGFSGGACVGYDEIRSVSGRYASYWNAFLFNGAYVTDSAV